MGLITSATAVVGWTIRLSMVQPNCNPTPGNCARRGVMEPTAIGQFSLYIQHFIDLDVMGRHGSGQTLNPKVARSRLARPTWSGQIFQ